LRSFVSSFFDYFILTNGSDKIVIILLLLVEICVEQQQTPQNKTLKVTNKTCKTIEPADKKKEEAPP
jgi:hypothetical protein